MALSVPRACPGGKGAKRKSRVGYQPAFVANAFELVGTPWRGDSSAVNALEVIQQFKALPPEERRQVARFVVEQDDSWIPAELEVSAVEADTDTEAVRAELLRRQQDYHDHPERFCRMDEESLKAMFHRIADARARLSSTH